MQFNGAVLTLEISVTMQKNNRILITLLICSYLCMACASNNSNDAPAEYLHAAGWLEPEKTLTGSRYEDYVSAIQALVKEHRVYFESAQAAEPIDELLAVTPKEYKPVPECAGTPARGIAILVHGLSDTAFAMHDLASHLASTCYIARTVLLPGHGTRAGDLLVVDHHDWLQSIRYLTQQAAMEHDNVVLGGFSLGAALTLTIAIEADSPVKSVIGISPAYTIAASRLARLAPLLDWAIPWLDKTPPDDFARYGAAASRSVSETVAAIRHLKSVLGTNGSVEVPWLLLQSMDDAVVQPALNNDFHANAAVNPKSRIVNFYSDQSTLATDVANDDSATWVRSNDDEKRVHGLTHVAVHISPDNTHYGVNGSFRNCGVRSKRSTEAVKLCQSAEDIKLGLWNDVQFSEGNWALSTYNPHFSVFTDHIDQFLESE